MPAEYVGIENIATNCFLTGNDDVIVVSRNLANLIDVRFLQRKTQNDVLHWNRPKKLYDDSRKVILKLHEASSIHQRSPDLVTQHGGLDGARMVADNQAKGS